ncbi:MAG TPA: PAC2 family protein [Dehalococcoidia bacterium]|nr:PAC2 family protein [Dehalococcoidia bacterium]
MPEPKPTPDANEEQRPRTRRRRAVAPSAAALQIERVPALREPVIVCAFAGWNDAAESATGAVKHLIERFHAPRFAGIDPEEFYVFTETRPTIKLVEGTQRELSWPANDFHYFRNSRSSRDLVLMAGREPALNWHSFTAAILELAGKVNARALVLLGGLLADVPHSRPVRVTGTTTNPEIFAQWPDLGVRRSRYEGPTGIVGVLSDACRGAGMPTASIWANVPHYINVSPNPKTLVALVRYVDQLFDLDLDLVELDNASARFERQVAEAVDQNPDVRRYVRMLEEQGEQADDEPVERPSGDLPSGAAIVEELEEFLRQRHQQDDDDDEDDDDE